MPDSGRHPHKMTLGASAMPQMEYLVLADYVRQDEDIRRALNRRSGEPRVGNNGAIVVLGYATRGRILKIVLTPDQEEIITLAWPDE
jgi:hypothetical protein